MNKHCKGCISHCNAGHKKDSADAKIYNDWCAKFSGHASKKVSHCLVHGGKTLKEQAK